MRTSGWATGSAVGQLPPNEPFAMISAPAVGLERDEQDAVPLAAVRIARRARLHVPMRDARISLGCQDLVGVLDVFLDAARPPPNDLILPSPRLRERADGIRRVRREERGYIVGPVRDPGREIRPEPPVEPIPIHRATLPSSPHEGPDVGPAILWRLPLSGREQLGKPPSSSGLGYRPFKAATRVRIPLGARSTNFIHAGVEESGVLIALSRRRSRDRSPSPAPDPPGEVAQMAEHAAENRGVGSSILPLATARL